MTPVYKPVAVMVARPASLPVFDDSWKDKCRACAFLQEKAPSMRCLAEQKKPDRKKGDSPFIRSAIEMRDVDGACGVEARLFEKREGL